MSTGGGISGANEQDPNARKEGAQDKDMLPPPLGKQQASKQFETFMQAMTIFAHQAVVVAEAWKRLHPEHEDRTSEVVAEGKRATTTSEEQFRG